MQGQGVLVVEERDFQAGLDRLDGLGDGRLGDVDFQVLEQQRQQLAAVALGLPADRPGFAATLGLVNAIVNLAAGRALGLEHQGGRPQHDGQRRAAGEGLQFFGNFHASELLAAGVIQFQLELQAAGDLIDGFERRDSLG